ncbi:glycosyltransferase family 4 protein [Candidatus Gracilibacteria bacterium]|nr:glycosyltransferase family 4 protein [Candidatus Gracilibacteria bacterium]
MRIVIVHDYLHQYGGAEKVVEKWLQMYPQADVFTSFITPETFLDSKEIIMAYQENRIHTTWLQRFIPRFIQFYKHFYWIYPITMSRVTVKNYDLVLISSTYCAKNVQYQNCAKLIHYCHSPTRFLHGLVTETDHKTLNPILRFLIPIINWPLKWMDLKAVHYLNENKCQWVANSNFIQRTIQDVYNTKSEVIYPPIEIDKFLKAQKSTLPKEYFLSHGRISFHKRIDLAIQACIKSNKKLFISGSSAFLEEFKKLKNLVALAEKKDPSKKGLIKFLGRTSDEEYIELLRKAEGFLFPGKEDFGITPIEVLASGTPIIAYKSGGALEYIVDQKNGIFFEEQNISSITHALKRFEKTKFNSKIIKESAMPFSSKKFEESIKQLILEINKR